MLPFQKKAGRNPRFATALNDLHLAVLTAKQITTHIAVVSGSMVRFLEKPGRCLDILRFVFRSERVLITSLFKGERYAPGHS